MAFTTTTAQAAVTALRRALQLGTIATQRIVLRITEGLDRRLVADETDTFVEACEGHRGPLVVDLSDLHFADDAGVGALRQLKAQGARIVGARPYLSLQLADGDDPITGSS